MAYFVTCDHLGQVEMWAPSKPPPPIDTLQPKLWGLTSDGASGWLSKAFGSSVGTAQRTVSSSAEVGQAAQLPHWGRPGPDGWSCSPGRPAAQSDAGGRCSGCAEPGRPGTPPTSSCPHPSSSAFIPQPDIDFPSTPGGQALMLGLCVPPGAVRC